MKRLLLLAMFAVAAASCGTNTGSVNQTNTTDTTFDAFKERFIESFWQHAPAYASAQGYHKYDSLLSIQDEAQRRTLVSFANAELDSLHRFQLNGLSENNRTDYHIIEDQLKGMIWRVNELRDWEWDPSTYNVGETFASMLNNEYDSLDIRLGNFAKRLAQVPAYYAAAKTNLKSPTLEHTALAIEQNEGALSVFTTDLPAALAKAPMPAAEKARIERLSDSAQASIRDYIEFLKTLKNPSPRSFRLGKELYAKKFEFDIQSHYSAEEIFRKAVAHKQDLHGEMARLARQLWPKYMGDAAMPSDSLQMIRAVIDKISLRHVQADSFQAAIEAQLPVLQKFVSDHDLLYIDPKKPLVVRREPAYMAGVAGASISAPGPYDKNGNTYYNVGSLSGWPAEQAESYLREYNHYILQILNIHEAIPGHYTQLVYANQSPSLIKSIFGSSSMIEGWAVYTERMMLEEGYGNNEPEMWLMYYKWNLRSTCNTILDYSVHTGSMTKDQALHLLMDEAFQQQAEAEGKWKRVSVTQVQLCCYFTGYTEIYDFREELKARQGAAFKLKTFHENFLGYGSAPVKYIRELMLKQ